MYGKLLPPPLGQGCYMYKKDLKRTYREFLIDPKDYKFLGFVWDDALYFDTRCPFRLWSSAVICQGTTRVVISVFTKEGYLADVYLDDFYGRPRCFQSSPDFIQQTGFTILTRKGLPAFHADDVPGDSRRH